MRAIKRIIYLDKPKEQVFKTIFTKDYYTKWFSPFGKNITITGELKKDGVVEFNDPAHGTMGGIVKKYEQNKIVKLEYDYHINSKGQKNRFAEPDFEQYEFENDTEDKTCLIITFSTDESCVDQVNGLWDKAIDILIDLYR